MVISLVIFSCSHFLFIARVLLGGLDVITPPLQMFIVLFQRHVSVLNKHMGQVGLWRQQRKGKWTSELR